MQHPNKALWRIEFRTNLTRADAPVFPIGYLLETHWQNQVRWLGLLFRRRLTVPELDIVNTDTWPELKDLEPFMKGLFDEAWAASIEPAATEAPDLGSAVVAAKYQLRSALLFSHQEPALDLSGYDPVDAFPLLYSRLLGFRAALAPTLIAPVVPLNNRKKIGPPPRPVVRPDVELMNQAA
jgi:hypothetical protein